MIEDIKKELKTLYKEKSDYISRFENLDLSDEEISELLDICKKKYPAAYPVIYLTLSTGASVPEILALTWERINFEDNTVFLKYFLYEQRLVMNRFGSTIRKLKFDDNVSGILKKKFEGTKPELTDFVFKFDSQKTPQQYIENVVLRTYVYYNIFTMVVVL